MGLNAQPSRGDLTSMRPSCQRRLMRTVLLCLGVAIACRMLYLYLTTPTVNVSSLLHASDMSSHTRPPPKAVADMQKSIVVASLASNDNSWLFEHFPDWAVEIYVMDANTSRTGSTTNTVPANKGGESMAYLTYIIDHYDDLPDISVFIHAGRYQWHNEDPMYDALPVLQRLQLPYVDYAGYVNLRCSWDFGCPNGLQPFYRTIVTDAKDLFLALFPGWSDDRARTQTFYSTAFRQLMPDTPVPTVIGVPCCNQFALTKWKIHERPVEDYIRYRQWLIDCPLGREITGRVMEYTWHIIMGMPAVYCQDASECFCLKFGLCDLDCTQDHCKNRYLVPPTPFMPVGWPEVGPGENGWPERDWYLSQPIT